MTKVPQHMMDAIPSGATFVKHETGSTWNDGGSWHRVYFKNADGSGGIVSMETDYWPKDLALKPWTPPPRNYTQSEYDAALARAERAEAALANAWEMGRDAAAAWCNENTMDIPMDHSKRVYAGLYCAGENVGGKHQGMGYAEAIRAIPVPDDLSASEAT